MSRPKRANGAAANKVPPQSEKKKLGRRLTLVFVSADNPELDRIEFVYKRESQPARLARGATDKEKGFLWTAVPQAVSLLFLDYLIWEKSKITQSFSFPKASEENLAASIGDDRYKEAGILKRLFVDLQNGGGRSAQVHNALKIRFHSRTTRPQAITIKWDFLPPDCVEVFWDYHGTDPLKELCDFQDLAKRIRESLGLPPGKSQQIAKSESVESPGTTSSDESASGTTQVFTPSAPPPQQPTGDATPALAPAGQEPSTPIGQSIPAEVESLLGEGRKLASQGRHAEADVKCVQALAIAKACHCLPPVRIDDLDDLEHLRPPCRRVLYYQLWREAKAKYSVPPASAAKMEYQKALNVQSPLNLSRMHDLIGFLGIREWTFPLPISPRLFADAYTEDARKRFCRAVGDAIQAVVRKANPQRMASLNQKVAAVTHFLCEEDSLPDGGMDIAFVPGYRSHLRAERAGELFKAGKIRRIFLSGHSPFYADNEDEPTPLTEAFAMAVYLVDKRPDLGVCWDDLIVDSRARCTRENVQFSLTKLAEAKTLLGHPLSILLVTSPYHLRRTWLMWAKFQRDNPEPVAELRRAASSTKESLLPDRWHLNNEGVVAYMTECWKIHGGRATGEF